MAKEVEITDEIDIDDDFKKNFTSSDEQNENMKTNSCLKSFQDHTGNHCTIERVNQRGQIDVIDMQEYETKKYAFFFIYEEQFSKYVILKALKSNCIDEIVEKLIDIFMIIGVPKILQSKDGIDYVKKLLRQVKEQLPGVKIIPDELMKDSHIKRDFKNLVKSWQVKNPTKEWHEGLKYIQILENIAKNDNKTKPPATYILKQNICSDLKSIFEKNVIIDELRSNGNPLTDQITSKHDSSINKHETVSNDKIEEKSTPKIIGKDVQSCDKNIVYSELVSETDRVNTPEIDDKSTQPQSNNTEVETNYNKTLKRNLSDSNSKKFGSRPTLGRKKKSNDSAKVSSHPLLECIYCNHKFNFPSVLKRHMRTHTNERPYVCQICNKSFKQLGHLSQHSLTHTDYRSFQCNICGIKCQSFDLLKEHSISHKDMMKSNRRSTNDTYRLYECDICKKVFPTKSVLERHIFTHTHERHFGCKICGKRFKQAGHVKSHMLTHTGERKFSCSICSKRFSLSHALKKHMYVHNGEKPYQCDVCGARFLEKRNLNGHLMTHTNERPFGCKICDKRYTLADTLKRHVSAAHEEGRTYQCEICAKMFKQLAHLSVHKKIHTDERPFQCHLCEKNFKHKNVLKSHLAIHANIRPFECDVCKATFVRKTNLQTHITSAHMNQRPHICTICNKRFKQISHLNGHIIVHSNSLPYQCEFCEKRCNRIDNLKKHMKIHEKN